jgi:hypothetical protein
MPIMQLARAHCPRAVAKEGTDIEQIATVFD